MPTRPVAVIHVRLLAASLVRARLLLAAPLPAAVAPLVLAPLRPVAVTLPVLARHAVATPPVPAPR